jgi:ketosteroid isomerase-like protein
VSQERDAARQVALAYYEAWTSGDLDRAMGYVDERIVCEAPAGRIEGAAAYREFIGPFVGMLKRAELCAAFGDEETAVVMYDTETSLVASAPGAECLTVREGKITRSRFVFDRKPFEDARAQVG